MTRLYGRQLSRLELERRTGSLLQFAGIQAGTFSDGLERGVRFLDFRTGSGLQFKVLVDRAMDVGPFEFRGAAVGWHSPTGFRNPGLHEHEGEGGLAWLRSMSGLMQTGGLDHTLFMDSDPSPHYVYEHRRAVKSSLHGRIANIPARLTGYGESWRGDECTFWCEGVVTQAAVFGEDLQLHRRIEAKLGENSFTVHDRVVNHGFYRTPHMFLYHLNVGYPVLDEGAQFLAPIRHTPWASHAADLHKQNVGYRTQPAPQKHFHEQVWEHAIGEDESGVVPVGVVNRAFDGGRGIGLLIEFRKREFPCLFQWQNFQEGMYGLGIEPSTNHVLGKPFAKERDELRWLEHGEAYNYTTRFLVLEDNAAIDREAARIQRIAAQDTAEYPAITGRWDKVAASRMP
jgi:hypothetical protein